MSEFTFGNIVRTVNRSIICENLPSGTPIMQLNEEWLAFFTENDGEQRSSDLAEEISKHCPILYFYNLEDHCWGYEILNGGDVLSTFHFSYELESELLFDIASDRYPDIKRITTFLYNTEEGKKVLDEIQSQLQDPSFLEIEVRKHFESVNVDDFKFFELEGEIIDELRKLLIADTYLNGEYDAIDRFKTLLDIEKMCWIRYDRTEDREDIEYI
ncbi:hypothetical protein QFZ81_003746 [Paenibacillus sp. V4I9]|jgi:hypothetical protein|uniref:hypothetical protein n=1 Tax=Paenibacillus sp. V4I9 TaxID=3042308 RepID=UPI002789E8B5|nr:hypothetical protein [Paenibacillus sp. V4I9]MDQ0888658.1 hypothetical protein [Paenibacillus sp. V4I9]